MDVAELNLTITIGTHYGGVVVSYVDDAGDPFPLGGWKAYAEIRKKGTKRLVYDLAPTIAADDTAGAVTIPPITNPVTAALPEGVHLWDIILEDSTGKRYKPRVVGTVTIEHTTTQPSPYSSTSS